MSTRSRPEVRGYAGWEVAVSALVALVVLALVVWWLSGFEVFYESLFRVGPTVEGGGVGADWTTGNTIGYLDFLIALVHAADVILGLFILFLVFVHWAAFRRLADRMTTETRETAGRETATDGGAVESSAVDGADSETGGDAS